MIDLRSDTVTKPTQGMRRAMIDAEVGDDVFSEDPTVNRLHEKLAHLFGFEAGLFVPSGVMGNQIAIKLLTNPGDEVIIEQMGHVFNYESTSAALISSVQLHPVEGSRGKLTPDLIQGALRSGLDWEPISKIVVVENSTNKGGGACYTKDELSEIRATANKHSLSVHLDGARIWNAMEATGIEPPFFSSVADTMSVAFSKGLGAPAGSMVLSSKENIARARRIRKMLGGGMRQIGMLAAAADYGLDHHLPLLKEDHRRARELAKTIDTCSGLSIDLNTVETNIIIFDVLQGSAEEAVKLLGEQGVGLVPFGPKTLRATFHFQVDDEDLHQAQTIIRSLFD